MLTGPPCTDLTLWGQLTQGLYFLFAFYVEMRMRSDMSASWGWLARTPSQTGAASPQSIVASLAPPTMCFGIADNLLDNNLSAATKVRMYLVAKAVACLPANPELCTLRHGLGCPVLPTLLC